MRRLSFFPTLRIMSSIDLEARALCASVLLTSLRSIVVISPNPGLRDNRCEQQHERSFASRHISRGRRPEAAIPASARVDSANFNGHRPSGPETTEMSNLNKSRPRSRTDRHPGRAGSVQNWSRIVARVTAAIEHDLFDMYLPDMLVLCF
jgi:hypothetical protein